jgi:hypothetical protein
MHSHNITPFLRWSFPASHSRRVVLCLPINVVICIVLAIIVCPRVVLYKGARTPGIGVAGWDWAVTILLTEAVGISAGVTAVSPAVAVPTVAVLGATGGEMANLVTGVAARPSLKVSWAVGMDMAHMATHGAKVVHVNDWGGGRTRQGVLQLRGSWGKGEVEEHGGGGRADSVRGDGANLTFVGMMVLLLANGAGGRGGFAFSLVSLLSLLSVRWNRNRV